MIRKLGFISGKDPRIEVLLSNTTTVLITPLYEHYEIHDPLYAELLEPLARHYNP